MRVVRLDSLSQFAAVQLDADLGHKPGKVTIPNYCRVRLSWLLGDGKGATVWLGGTVSSGFVATPAVAQSIFAALTTGAAWTAFLAQMAPTVSFFGVTLRDIRTPDQPLVGSTGASIAGTATGTELPDEAAVVVSLRTNFVGQANRGRAYVPGFTSAAIGAGNTIGAATVTAVQNWANGWPAALAAGGVTLALAHPERNAYTSPRTGTAFPHRDAGSVPITSLTVRDNHWDSQRRRGLK